ncbi:tyrosine-type recombinase/integrase [Allopusillimonas ginsengisoli]|uniref:tyrosine-type recombinase/integrase n=1 Tax=Allopusillimonas ginsengisoli TaxID=453575 RepID=UPI001020F6CE|nr:tyrosine-type recombinase/integrase [Allopusillimonas ginsengisoli]TEA79494.1 hypothetical protein ERE07_00590 [Allopusillimonas ginsengisoli]
MSIYRIASGGWKLDFRTSEIRTSGDKPLRVTRVFNTKTQALHAQAELKKQVEAAKLNNLGIFNPQATIGQLIEKWWQECEETKVPESRKKISKIYAKTDDHREKSRKNAWVKSSIGQTKLIDLRVSKLERWINTRRDDDVSESTIRNDLSILSRLFRYMKKKWRYQIDNIVDIALQEVGHSNKRDRRLTPAEHRKILSIFEQLEQAQKYAHTRKAADPNYRIIIPATGGNKIDLMPHQSLLYARAAYAAAIECAMRRGKLFEICWSWISWSSTGDESVIVVPDQRQGPENKAVPALVPMSPTLHKILIELRGPQRIGAALDEPIFGSLLPDHAYRLLKTICEKLEIPDFRWHDLRHEACSRLADRGWTTQQIQRVSGHKTLQSLERYTHVDISVVHQLYKRDATRAKQEQQTETMTGTHN